MDITLPNVDCDACTLRIVQVNPDEDDYVSCADVQLQGAVAGTTGAGDTTGGGDQGTGPVGDDSSGGGDDAADDAPMPGDGSGTAGGGDTTGEQQADGDDASGCGCTTRSTTAPAWLMLLGLAALRRRRS